MDSPELLRQRMVKCQLMPEGISSPSLLKAFSKVPREVFLTLERHVMSAYQDGPLYVEEGRFLTRPTLLAKLIELAEPTPKDRVLYIGAMTGYGPCIMAELTAQVVAVEESVLLYTRLEHNMKRPGHPEIDIHLGPLTEGFKAKAPYDLIFVEGAVGYLPEALLAQLAPKGRVVGVWQRGDELSQAFILHPVAQGASPHPLFAFDTKLPMLPGFSKKNQFIF